MNKFVKLFSLLLIVSFLLTTGAMCGGAPQASLQPITLDYWGVWHEPNDIRIVIDDYRALYPYVTINYRQLRFEEYEQELLEAFAEDRGPDIFSIHNTWVNEYQPKIYPAPSQVNVARRIIEGTVRKQERIITESNIMPPVKDIPAIFPDVVAEDVVWPYETDEGTTSRIFGLPLTLDTLVLFYNRDLLNNANIPQPPKNWDDFIGQVQQLTQRDAEGNILVAGAALGTADNVTRFFDVLSLLMMQNKTEMATKQGVVSFDQRPRGADITPGLEALDFYTSFAMIDKGVYTWNDEMPNSLDAFIAGQAAFFFGYSYHIPVIRSRAPKLNFDVANVPQVDEKNRTNYANYWVETVSKKTKSRSHSWNFLRFITQQEEALKYVESAKRPTALRALINAQLIDPDLDIFADQILTAESWYRGKDSEAAEEIFRDMVNDVLEGEKLSDAISLAVKRMRNTWRD
jgi:multiple sugar transport system substrate-binding protein